MANIRANWRLIVMLLIVGAVAVAAKITLDATPSFQLSNTGYVLKCPALSANIGGDNFGPIHYGQDYVGTIPPEVWDEYWQTPYLKGLDGAEMAAATVRTEAGLAQKCDALRFGQLVNLVTIVGGGWSLLGVVEWGSRRRVRGV